MIDLSIVLHKEVTFPALLYVCYLLHRDLKSAKATSQVDDNAPEVETQHHVNPSSSLEWNPNPAMSSVRRIDSEEDYKPWHETKPYPYKPFKAGEYRLTMGVRPIPSDDWLVLENTYKERIESKWEIIKSNYKDVIYHLDPAMINCSESDIGQKTSGKVLTEEILITQKDVENSNVALCELYSYVTSFLIQRFPQFFEMKLSPSEESPGVFYNKILDEFHPLDPAKYLELEDGDISFLKYCCMNVEFIPRELQEGNCKTDKVGYIPLVTCSKTRRAHELILSMSRMVEEDLVLLLPNASRQYNGEYILFTGCFAFAAGFNPRQRYLKPLTLIHGPVPDYKRNLQSQMNKFFETTRQGKVVMRLNFSFQVHDKLYVTQENKGTEDEEIRAKTLDELRGGHDLYYRSERQCVVKLGPQSNAICFSIKTYLWNMAEQFLEDEFYAQESVIEDLRSAVTGMQENIGQYKRRPEWGPALVDLLQKRLERFK
ncbi:LAFE_0B08394g1_1 [Lachancea fermentati]|uniref:LAFE_0B08394g1_1 n=1 Tax=Lachancea fermentati TaxID=4955 RepID=A0A1G4M8M7_LACFM|nr:LAFE_0B08394g1_1 [Lachancea fermentati]